MRPLSRSWYDTAAGHGSRPCCLTLLFVSLLAFLMFLHHAHIIISSPRSPPPSPSCLASPTSSTRNALGARHTSMRGTTSARPLTTSPATRPILTRACPAYMCTHPAQAAATSARTLHREQPSEHPVQAAAHARKAICAVHPPWKRTLRVHAACMPCRLRHAYGKRCTRCVHTKRQDPRRCTNLHATCAALSSTPALTEHRG